MVALANTDQGIFLISYEVGVVTEVDVATMIFTFLATLEISNGNIIKFSRPSAYWTRHLNNTHPNQDTNLSFCGPKISVKVYPTFVSFCNGSSASCNWGKTGKNRLKDWQCSLDDLTGSLSTWDNYQLMQASAIA